MAGRAETVDGAAGGGLPENLVGDVHRVGVESDLPLVGTGDVRAGYGANPVGVRGGDELSLGLGVLLDEFIAGATGHNAPVGENDKHIAEPFHDVELVRGKQDGNTGVGSFLQYLQSDVHCVRVQAGKWFV